jgi:hypothetical protein
MSAYRSSTEDSTSRICSPFLKYRCTRMRSSNCSTRQLPLYKLYPKFFIELTLGEVSCVHVQKRQCPRGALRRQSVSGRGRFAAGLVLACARISRLGVWRPSLTRRVRSPIRLRSSSVRIPIICYMARPVGVSVSIAAVSDWNFTPRFFMVIRSRKLPLSRSSFHTMSVSPCSSFFKLKRRVGRFVVAPNTPSSFKIVFVSGLLQGREFTGHALSSVETRHSRFHRSILHQTYATRQALYVLALRQ